MKKRAVGKISILFIFIFIGLTIILSITLYNMSQEISKREENTLQLEIDLINIQIKNTELSKQLEENNKVLNQLTQNLNEVKRENREINTQIEKYEIQIEVLTETKETIYSNLHDRGNIRFIVIADIHAGGPKGNDRPVFKESVDWDPDFVILAGDMVHGTGWDQAEWVILFENLVPIITANIPIYPVIGNHDGYFPATQEDLTPIWAQVPDWAVDIGKGWYSFIIDNVKIVVVENNFKHTWNCENFDDFGLVSEQREYVETELSKPSKWVFVVSHKGAYWNAESHSDSMFKMSDKDYMCNQKIFDEWNQKYSIDMFISGHQHFGDTYYLNQTLFSHVPGAYEFYETEPQFRGQFVIYDIFSPNDFYPDGSIRIRHINFDGEVIYDKIFAKNTDQ